VTRDHDDNDNDNDKRLGLTAKADQPDHKKYSITLKIKQTMKQYKSYTRVKSKRGISFTKRRLGFEVGAGYGLWGVPLPMGSR